MNHTNKTFIQTGSSSDAQELGYAVYSGKSEHTCIDLSQKPNHTLSVKLSNGEFVTLSFTQPHLNGGNLDIMYHGDLNLNTVTFRDDNDGVKHPKYVADKGNTCLVSFEAAERE
ncbi:hypothetical protein J2Z48_002949 [Croceifilum oryzae]|uniref:Uncharacterized protein n=1 Tax=Croceifilum oryzae TaxID=1553429 RepID=A0AAJ1TH06_9BACL|nr:hypothetical protein [Croceifilum oryzae]MDQ0418745.1 hypothetical protein [Croceifilum oryzae]